MEFKKYFQVLKACNEEPGNIDHIVMESNLDENNVIKILANLQNEGLVYEEDKIWAITAKGNKYIQ